MSRGIKKVMWIHAKDWRLQARLVVCTHMGGRGHHGKLSALRVLLPYEYCVRNTTKAEVGEFVMQCVRSVYSEAGELKPLSLG